MHRPRRKAETRQNAAISFEAQPFSRLCSIRTPDDCKCCCSVAGCLPAGIFTKVWSHPADRADALDSFISYISPDCVEAAYLDACRVKFSGDWAWSIPAVKQKGVIL